MLTFLLSRLRFQLTQSISTFKKYTQSSISITRMDKSGNRQIGLSIKYFAMKNDADLVLSRC